MGHFPPSALGGQGVAHGYKGKGVTTHVLTDFNRHPLAALSTAAHIDERKQVLHLYRGSWKLETAGYDPRSR